MSTTPNQKDLLAKKSDLEGILKPDDNDVLHLPDVTITLAEDGQFYLAGIDKKLLTLVGDTSGNAVTLDGDAGLTFTTSGGSSTITGITSSSGNSTSLAASQSMTSAKQDKIIAGANITIAQDGKTISATDTTYSTFNGASASADGSTGLVPKPFIADKDKYLRGDGTWQTIQATPALNDLTDVDLTTPTDGQILKYDAVNQEWINANENPGVTELSGLTDVDVTTTTPTNGQGLVYNSTSEKWENANVLASASVSTLTDVNLTSLKNGQVLKYNTSTQKWVNAEDIDETNEFGPSAPTASMGKDGQIYMQYVNPTTITYSTVWTGLALSRYANQPAKVEGFNPSKYYKIRVVGVSYDANVNDEKLVSEIPESSTYSNGWKIGDRMYITTQNNGTELWVYNAPSHPTYPSYITRIDAAQPSEISKVYGKIANNWIEFPGGGGSSTLASLSDVDITSPTNGQVLKYDSTNQEWVNANESGGGGNAELEETPLYTTPITVAGTYTLLDNIEDYDFVSFVSGVSYEADIRLFAVSDMLNMLDNNLIINCAGTAGRWFNITALSGDQLSVTLETNPQTMIHSVMGYKIKGGSGGGTGGGVTEETLWTGPSNSGSYTLTTPITNYDAIIVYGAGYLDNDASLIIPLFIPTANIEYGQQYMANGSGSGERRAFVVFSDSTHFSLNYYGNQYCGFEKITGLKFGGSGSSVTPNPTDPATDTLSSIEIDGTVYSVGGGDASAEEMTLAEYSELTEQQKNDGTIRFIPAGSGSVTSAIDMTDIAVYREGGSAMSVTSASSKIDITWNGGMAIACNIDFNTPIDVTDYDRITFKVTNGSCYNNGSQAMYPRWDMMIGLRSAPLGSLTNIEPTDSSWAAVADMPLSNHVYEETLDVSELTGSYYLVISGHGWNSTIEDITLRQGGDYPSQIRYMSKTYGISSGGGGSRDTFITYSKSVTTTQYGWWIVEDEDGNTLDPDTYVIIDISVNVRYYDVLWYQDSAGDYRATLFDINDGNTIRSSSTRTWTITYAKKDFSGGGSGSSVTPNPTDPATDILSSIEIDGTVYEIQSSSGGGSTFETVFAGSKSTSRWAEPIIFNEFDVTAYDIIRITAAHDGGSYVWLLDTDIIPVKPANTFHIYGEAYCDRDGTSFEMYVSSSHNLSVSKIEGLVEGTGSSMVHYSTTEHQVGTWIDGSDVYEKVISISNVSLSSGGYETVDTITGLDSIISCNGYIVEGNLKYTLNDITLRVVQDGTSVKFYSPVGTTWTISSGAIIIRYTKVT